MSKYKYWRFWQLINTGSEKRRTKVPVLLAIIACFVFTGAYFFTH